MLQGIIKRITNNRWQNVSSAEIAYKKNKEALSIENGVVVLGTRAVIPDMLKKKLLHAAHDSHFGMSTTKISLQRNVWWPGMDRDVEEFVRNCELCAEKLKSNTARIAHKWTEEKQPFDRVHFDWAHIKGVGEILIMVDAMSGWPEAHYCKDRSSSRVLKIMRCILVGLEFQEELSLIAKRICIR